MKSHVFNHYSSFLRALEENKNILNFYIIDLIFAYLFLKPKLKEPLVIPVMLHKFDHLLLASLHWISYQCPYPVIKLVILLRNVPTVLRGSTKWLRKNITIFSMRLNRLDNLTCWHRLKNNYSYFFDILKWNGSILLGENLSVRVFIPPPPSLSIPFLKFRHLLFQINNYQYGVLASYVGLKHQK